ncbi:nucleolar complex-associated protein 3 [Irpex rosettiformis]|uniref:Nucleolar complex-associated protein 3 n=1 Tax=Irpex rosettiformis TaxID=378272 RepID=A0ACB8UGZ7_9APHY|nr:nucleolar complex-associated protein 3 [Irpex rosettiformis]
MAIKHTQKRKGQQTVGPSKKRKLSSGVTESGKKSKAKGKQKAADRGVIPIPALDDDGVELSDDDMDMLEEFGSGAAFLTALDEKGIARSKKETERLHRLHKPVRAAVEDDLPSIHSDDGNDEDEWSSGIENDSQEDDNEGDFDVFSDEGSSSASSQVFRKKKTKRARSDDEEMPYETQPRKPQAAWDSGSDDENAVKRLPIKLADGRVQESSNSKVLLPREKHSTKQDSESESNSPPSIYHSKVEDVSTGARFGRPAVIDVVGHKSRKVRIQAAKEQIAGICQEIVADPENSLGLLRRLHTFSLPEISTPTHPEPLPNDDIIRKLTFLSQLAVFQDIIPGYRIRALTDKEKSEKVSQMVQRTRDWEQGLVGVYQGYLRILEGEVKGKTDLAEVALQCMCTLLTAVTHFNFRVNLMSTIVSYLSRKSWDKTSNLCLNTVITVFREDTTGVPSLEIVRLLNRMIKERRFNVHPEVLSCLTYLRLKTELGVRASESKADKPETRALPKGKAAARRAKGKPTDQPHLSKKAKKMLKEKKEIEKEMHEAAADVDKEERSSNQTETLKLLFVLYFRILKNPLPTPLLPAALCGISRFSHLVNIDFFKDLMQVLKEQMTREPHAQLDNEPGTSQGSHIPDIQHHLLCIVTAFELLSGQGEALDIDLSDFSNRLYAMLPSLALMSDIETPPHTPSHLSSSSSLSPTIPKAASVADMLFRALHLAFSRRTAGTSPPWRSAAFAKRLAGASLHWPPSTAIRAIEFVGALIEQDPKLEALLSTDDRSVDGVYRPDLDDPQLSNPFGTNLWELFVLAETHWDKGVRDVAGKMLLGSR